MVPAKIKKECLEKWWVAAKLLPTLRSLSGKIPHTSKVNRQSVDKLPPPIG